MNWIGTMDERQENPACCSLCVWIGGSGEGSACLTHRREDERHHLEELDDDRKHGAHGVRRVLRNKGRRVGIGQTRHDISRAAHCKARQTFLVMTAKTPRRAAPAARLNCSSRLCPRVPNDDAAELPDPVPFVSPLLTEAILRMGHED